MRSKHYVIDLNHYMVLNNYYMIDFDPNSLYIRENLFFNAILCNLL